MARAIPYYTGKVQVWAKGRGLVYDEPFESGEHLFDLEAAIKSIASGIETCDIIPLDRDGDEEDDDDGQ